MISIQTGIQDNPNSLTGDKLQVVRFYIRKNGEYIVFTTSFTYCIYKMYKTAWKIQQS